MSKRELDKLELDARRKALELYFVDLTGLSLPKSKKASAVLWWSPLRMILVASDWRLNRAVWAVEQAVGRIGLERVKTPRSVEKIAISVLAKTEPRPSPVVMGRIPPIFDGDREDAEGLGVIGGRLVELYPRRQA